MDKYGIDTFESIRSTLILLCPDSARSALHCIAKRRVQLNLRRTWLPIDFGCHSLLQNLYRRHPRPQFTSLHFTSLHAMQPRSCVRQHKHHCYNYRVLYNYNYNAPPSPYCLIHKSSFGLLFVRSLWRKWSINNTLSK